MKQNQHGFGVVGLVLVVGLAGVLGLMVFNDATQKVAVQQAAQNNSQNQTETPKAAPALVIKEWGVKIPLSSADAGAYYVPSENVVQSPADPTNMIVYSKETDAITGPTGVSCKGEYIAFIMRLPKDDPKWQPSQEMGDGNVSGAFSNRTVVGAYRYAVATLKQYAPDCFAAAAAPNDYKPDPATTERFDTVKNAFVTDFKNIRAK